MLTEWLACCVSKPVVRRALLSGLIVGTILVAINHGDALVQGQVDPPRMFKIILTVIVPYLVSTVSSASTIVGMRRGGPD
ncbi:MAG TPA: nitrate/nitrite transporter NrtS [Anaerolineales bacterium]|nr:nitrate/nitrite transporter NrtS [Anaerolineales bacterium]